MPIQSTNTSPCHENSWRTTVCCQFLEFFHSFFTSSSVIQLPIHDTTNEWIPTKIRKVVTFSNMALGVKYCDIPYITIPTHKNLPKYSTFSTCYYTELDLEVESVVSTPYNSIHHSILPHVSYKKHRLQIQTAIPHHVEKNTSLARLLSISGIFTSNLHILINIAISNIRHNKRMESDKNSKTWKYFNTDSRSNIMWNQASQYHH